MSAAADAQAKWDQLTEGDFAKLAARWITPELARDAGIRRVTSIDGAEMFARKGKDISGLIIPNVLPGLGVREYRIRLDHPDFQIGIDGVKRETGMKYLSPPGKPPLIYFPPGVTPEMMADVSLPVIITEGEFKAIALWRLARHESHTPRFLPIALQGVDCWKGTIGKTQNAAGKRVSIKGMLPDLSDRMVLNNRRIIIAYDADIAEKEAVEKARNRLLYALIERDAKVAFLEWDMAQGKGIDDRLANVGPEPVLADIAKVQFGGWRMMLLHNEEGKMMTCFENVALFLENSPEWAGVLGYNEFTGGHVILRQGPSSFQPGAELEDHFDIEVVRWLERVHLMATPNMVRPVVDLIAHKNSFHPVRDYLDRLPAWDKVPRIDTWLINYCHVESSKEKRNCYAMEVGRMFLVSAIARICDPGCKVDHVLILEGPQGIGKSEAVRILAVNDEWFTDQLADLGSQNCLMQLRGRWIVELGELDALNRADMSRTKAFLSEQSDKFRVPYGRRIVPFPRQCVFIGTTNQDTWLKDETGGRRFWPVRCPAQIDLEGLRKVRDQLWAEALHKHREGAHWWPENAALIQAANEEQKGRHLPDPWLDLVEDFAESLCLEFREGPKASSVKAEAILQKIVTDPAKQDLAALNRVVRCLKFMGWERKNLRKHGEKTDWRYKKGECSTK
jgi:predicted P-loop ATPase